MFYLWPYSLSYLPGFERERVGYFCSWRWGEGPRVRPLCVRMYWPTYFFFFFLLKINFFARKSYTHTHTHILRYNTCNITTTNIISSFIRFSKWIIQRFLFHIYTYTSIYVYIVVATRNKSRMTLIVNIILYNLRVYIVPRMTDPFRSWCVRAREINSEISTTILVGLKNFRHRDVFYSYSLFI